MLAFSRENKDVTKALGKFNKRFSVLQHKLDERNPNTKKKRSEIKRRNRTHEHQKKMKTFTRAKHVGVLEVEPISDWQGCVCGVLHASAKAPSRSHSNCSSLAFEVVFFIRSFRSFSSHHDASLLRLSPLAHNHDLQHWSHRPFRKGRA